MCAIRIALLALVTASCGLPRDPDGTLDRIRGGVLRVGLVHNPPWASLAASGEAAGVEPRLVRALAAGLGARVEWVPGGESELLSALEERQLDLVVGGLSATSPWAPKLALSRPYYTDTLALGAVPDEPAPGELRDVRVGVERSRSAPAALKGEGAVPVPVPDLAGFAGPVAAPVWRLAQMGRLADGRVLHREERVVAAPPGENAWLVHVERFLHAHADSVGLLLRREAP